ncbi:MAG: PIN domain-containing protein [Nitrososphaeria archaeon]
MYVLDTNIISAILKDNEETKKILFKKILSGKEIFINAITYYEIKRGLLKTNDIGRLERFNLFCFEHNLIFIDNIDILNIASEIYAYLNKKGQSIGDADILIAAMTMSKNFILVTNDKHFARIENLKIENWL